MSAGNIVHRIQENSTITNGGGRAVWPINQVWTIDAAPDPTLDCIRKRWPRLKKHQHHCAEEAIDNIIHGKNVQAVNIIGHGCSGLIVTGKGKTVIDGQNSDFVISTLNVQAGLKTVIEKIENPNTIITLWGCNTGEGQDGASLLHKLANATNSICVAPTGLLLLAENGFELDERAAFQCASPGQDQPNAISRPFFSVELSDLSAWKLLFEFGTFRANTSFEISFINDDKRKNSITVTDRGNVLTLLKKIDVSKPMNLACGLLALPTGTLSVKAGRSSQIQFTIWNDALAQKNGSNAYYRLDGDFFRSLSEFAALENR